MKEITLALCAFYLFGCAATGTGGVVEIAPNTYMIGGQDYFESSGSVMKVKYFKQATGYCASKGLTMQPLNSTGQDSSKYQSAAAEVQFRCVESK